MGSLMAGWASHVPDPKAVKYQRNWSLTREEIDTYWKSKKEKEEEHDVKVVSEVRQSMPVAADTEGSFLDMENDDDKASLVKLILKNGWWTSSSSAFLNEPPVIASSEESYNKYASQFHVAAGSSETST